jgi:two-component system, NarL family, response regulator NreC
MNKIRVLIADDHAILREGISALLRLQSDIETVGEACNGQEAVEMAKKLAPDIVLMDVSMPLMDGLEATRRIKKDNPKVKVLVLTQHDNADYILSTVKAGSDGYLPKRAVGQDLLTAIRAIYHGNTFLYPTAAGALIDDYRLHAEKEPYDSLTDREKEVFRLIADGHSSREIADMLFISLKTVLNHRGKIMEKLNIHHSNDLIKLAIRKGLINSEE